MNFVIEEQDVPKLHVTTQHGGRVTTEQAMEALGVTRQTIAAYFRRGVLTRRRFGRRVLIPWCEVQALLTDGLPANGQNEKAQK